MSKLDQAVQIVSENMDKEVALTKIMQTNQTYRSNALTYYKKALAKLGKSMPTKASTTNATASV